MKYNIGCFFVLLLVIPNLTNAWPTSDEIARSMLAGKSRFSDNDGYMYIPSEQVYKYNLESIGFDFKAAAVDSIEANPVFKTTGSLPIKIVLKSSSDEVWANFFELEPDRNSFYGELSLLNKLITFSHAHIEPQGNGVYIVRAPIFFVYVTRMPPMGDISLSNKYYAAEWKLKLTLSVISRL